MSRKRLKKHLNYRDILVLCIFLIQLIHFVRIFTSHHKCSSFKRNPNPMDILVDRYENTAVYKDISISSNGNPLLISHEWHGGSPHIHPNLKQGSCWCSMEDYCLCTPSLAIDTVLVTADNQYFWLVQRKDTNKFATMGGFVEVGEKPEDAVRRELKEEMSLDLDLFPRQHNVSTVELFGIYGDPSRDARRHTVSIVYIVRIPDDVKPVAGDDAKSVLKVHVSQIKQMEFFADHERILADYLQRYR